jgi:hypothetical protein
VNACLGSCLFGMSLGAGALGGMLGMASGIFILLAATTFVSALLYAINRLRRPRGTALSVVSRPGAGNSARHHHLDDAIDRCALGAVASYRAVAVAALGARQSCWTAARPRRLPLCRSNPSAGGRWRDYLWFRHTDGGLAPAVAPTRHGQALDNVCDEPPPRSRRWGRLGHRGRAGGAARPAGADLPCCLPGRRQRPCARPFSRSSRFPMGWRSLPIRQRSASPPRPGLLPAA